MTDLDYDTYKKDTAVIMVTCKKYKQVWEPFFILFKRYWPQCPYKIYMVTDEEKYKYENMETITVGKDLGFSSNLIYGLNKIKENYIIYFQEDYLFTGIFDDLKILQFVKYATDNNIGCLRLTPCPGPTSGWPDSKFLGILQKGSEYRVSTQTAIWNKTVLLSLLKHGETGWNFEILGTIRSYTISDIFLSVWRGESPTPYYIAAIRNGKWQNGALDFLKKEGISLNSGQKL